MSKPQQPKPWHQRIRNLFERDLPFGHKVEKDKTKYTRKKKHKRRDYFTKDIDE